MPPPMPTTVPNFSIWVGNPRADDVEVGVTRFIRANSVVRFSDRLEDDRQRDPSPASEETNRQRDPLAVVGAAQHEELAGLPFFRHPGSLDPLQVDVFSRSLSSRDGEHGVSSTSAVKRGGPMECQAKLAGGYRR